MRGKPERRRQRHAGRRIIPAHAGQTLPYSARWMVYADHPRACGANHSGTIRPTSCIGSSPRMRGKLWQNRDFWLRLRIIPAHAGQTVSAVAQHNTLPDHPRACGANDHKRATHVCSSGSSPRMRGKRAGGKHDGRRVRIIPAHAGQTKSKRVRAFSMPDHPRACGANRPLDFNLKSERGSSPRMRGKLFCVFVLCFSLRIIPAHAGQTPPFDALS